MTRKRITYLLAAVALLFASTAWSNEDPQTLVKETAEAVLAEVTAKKPELEANPGLIYPLVEQTVLPHFDFEKMTRSAVGKDWRKADAAQREQLVGEFQQLLVRTYATALLGYSGQEIKYPPMRVRPDSDRVKVPTTISDPGAPAIPVVYSLHLENGKWKVYDVVVNNVSLVTTYRSQFGTEVRRGGIDGLITALVGKNASASARQ